MALSPRSTRRALAGGVLLLAGYFLVQGGEYSVWDILRLRRDRQATEARLAAVRAEADSLRRMADRLEHQDTAVERIAREQFGMVREGETLYRFAPPPAAAEPAAP